MDHQWQVFQTLCDAELSMKLSKCHFFTKEIQYLGHVLSTTCAKPLPLRTAAIKLMKPQKNAKQVRAFLGIDGYYCKLIKNFARIAKLLTALTHHDAKFSWTSGYHTVFNTLKSALIEASILHYPNPFKCNIVYTDCQRNTMAKNCQLHFFPTHSQTPKKKYNTTEQEAYGIYYAVTKWNYYLQGSDIVVHNNVQKPLWRFLNC